MDVKEETLARSKHGRKQRVDENNRFYEYEDSSSMFVCLPTEYLLRNRARVIYEVRWFTVKTATRTKSIKCTTLSWQSTITSETVRRVMQSINEVTTAVATSAPIQHRRLALGPQLSCHVNPCTHRVKL